MMMMMMMIIIIIMIICLINRFAEKGLNYTVVIKITIVHILTSQKYLIVIKFLNLSVLVKGTLVDWVLS